jgi:hypothetical protein
MLAFGEHARRTAADVGQTPAGGRRAAGPHHPSQTAAWPPSGSRKNSAAQTTRRPGACSGTPIGLGHEPGIEMPSGAAPGPPSSIIRHRPSTSSRAGAWRGDAMAPSPSRVRRRPIGRHRAGMTKAEELAAFAVRAAYEDLCPGPLVDPVGQSWLEPRLQR